MSNRLLTDYTGTIVKFLAGNKTFLFHVSLFMALASYLMLTYLPDNFKYSIGVLICSYVSITTFKSFIYLTAKHEIKKPLVLSIHTKDKNNKKDV